MHAMVKLKTVNVITLMVALSALALGIIKGKENLITPAMVLTILMFLAASKVEKGDRAPKAWLCCFIMAALAINMAGSFWTFERYTDAEWLDFLTAAPSHLVAAYSVVLFVIAYFGIRLDRLLFSLFTVFSTLSLSTTYTYVFAMLRHPAISDPDAIIANYYLNASSATMFALCLISLVAVNLYMRDKKIRMLYPRHITEPGSGKEA